MKYNLVLKFNETITFGIESIRKLFKLKKY